MVKDVKKQPPPSPQWKRRAVKMGRPYGDPRDVRSTRMVQRVHPHLVAAIQQRAREYGITQSQFIERILIDHLNNVEGAQLDSIGRWMDDRAWEEWRLLHRRDQPFPRSRIHFEIGKEVQAEVDAEDADRWQQEELMSQPGPREPGGRPLRIPGQKRPPVTKK